MTTTPGTGPCAHCGKAIIDPYKDAMLACFECRLIAGRAIGLEKVNEVKSAQLEQELKIEKTRIESERIALSKLLDRQHAATDEIERVSTRVKDLHWFLRKVPGAVGTPGDEWVKRQERPEPEPWYGPGTPMWRAVTLFQWGLVLYIVGKVILLATEAYRWVNGGAP